MSEEDNMEKKFEDIFENMGPINEWWDKNKPKEEIKHIFDNIERIIGFHIIQFNSMPRTKNEPKDGNIRYNDKLYYFKFHHEFDEGNTYIVYDGENNPVSYLSLYNDSEGDIDRPMLYEEQRY